MDKIEQALCKLFEGHRIVFWYDTKRELRADYEALDLAQIEKIEINKNEFGIKHRILRDQSDRKFLIYHEGPVPNDLENWLLDVQLSHAEFRSDQAAIWLSELGLGLEFSELTKTHLDFFKTEKRREKLKGLLEKDDTATAIKHKMLAVCVGSSNDIADILKILLSDLANETEDKWKLIERAQLAEHLFKCIKSEFGYESQNPSIKDFAFALFESCYAMQSGQTAKLGTEALLFLKRWRDSSKQKDVYEKLTEQHEELLKIKSDLENRDYRTLVEWNIFKIIERKILSGLIKDVLSDSLGM